MFSLLLLLLSQFHSFLLLFMFHCRNAIRFDVNERCTAAHDYHVDDDDVDAVITTYANVYKFWFLNGTKIRVKEFTIIHSLIFFFFFSFSILWHFLTALLPSDPYVCASVTLDCLLFLICNLLHVTWDIFYH